MNPGRLNRKNVRELRRQASNGNSVSPAELEVVIIKLCDSWLRKESEARRSRERHYESINFYEGLVKRRQELLKRLLYDALRKVEEGLPQETGGVRAGQLSVGATRIYDSVLNEIKNQM